MRMSSRIKNNGCLALFLIGLILHGVAQADALLSENTYGVETVEAPLVQIFFQPSVQLSNVIGNPTTDSTSHLGYGFQVGALISQQLLLQAGFSHQEMGLSLPAGSSVSSAAATLSGLNGNQAFSYKGNGVDLGARLYVLGRESRFRPFIGGAVSYAWNQLAYLPAVLANFGSDPTYSNDFTLKQIQGRGSLGLEVAITSMLVVDFQFSLQGVFTYWASTAANGATYLYDSDKLAVANALSRATTDQVTLGVGFYF